MSQQQPPRAPTPQDRARLEGLKRQFEQKKEMAEKLSSLKFKIGVYSGKGGVGKTTVAVNLAVTLARQGAKVGLLDVDIDCPNIVRALKVTEPPVSDNGRMIPPTHLGVKVMSMAFFQEDEEEAIIWRGPMVHNAINQILQTTDWGELDYLVVDLPPGTSDAPLTVMQVLNPDGFVVVTTPQELAKIDAKRSINMIKKLNLNVLGVVENFSDGIFGSGAGEEIAMEMGLSYLGKLKMRPDYTDTTKPAVLLNDDVRKEYEGVASLIRAEVEAGA